MRPTFNASGIAAVCSHSTLQSREFDPAFTTAQERRAGARAILRHNLHTKGNAVANGGLPQTYKELHGLGNAKGVELQEVKLVLKETFHDLLDTVSKYIYLKYWLEF